ncbi:hypothetical protein [Microbacterium lushaniae]|uniref:Uncharacterized protein n=1 Tax=Microbacterium lushaniae TaxID=2614639 RepID=A0A5J6L3W3_9MICO|nr:hypothetical protein [Microbacterium lushaniae]QEW03032.1 hypothetical protein F6J85_07900 [Microbacterium lushaniae]
MSPTHATDPAGVAWATVGLYADATGTSGYVPVTSWLAGILALAALVAGIATLNGRPHRNR